MTDIKQPESQAKRPGEILDQWNLIRAASQDGRLSRGDIAVLMAIVQRYWPKHGNGWATMEILVELSGVSYRQVIRAVKNLQQNGYVAVLSKGRRGSKDQPGKGTVFLPQFSLGHKYRDTHVTAIKGDIGVTSIQDCTDTDGTATTICPDTHVTPSYLPLPAYKAEEQVVGNEDTHATLPAHGLTASAAVSRDPFDEFWLHFPRKHQRSKAEAAWTKLAPDADLAAVIIEGAQRLAGHYAEHPIDKKWMKLPANWLAGKGWTEDLPEIYVDAKQAAIAKKVSQPKAEAANTNEPPESLDSDDDTELVWKDEISPFIFPGQHGATIVSAVILEDGGIIEINLEINVDTGRLVYSNTPFSFFPVHPDPAKQWRGQRLLSHLGGVDDEDAADLVGREYIMTVADDGEVSFKLTSPIESKPASTERPPFDMDNFMSKAKRITGEAA